jgi:hypothetical protein
VLWTKFAEQEPDLAGRGRVLLAEEHGYAYLWSTVAADGGLRLHPVAPILNRGLFVAVTRRSPKLADLRRTPTRGRLL